MTDKKMITDPLIKMIMQSKDGYTYSCINGLTVRQDWEIHDKKEWVHLTISKAHQTPTYFDVKWVKDTFLGPNKKAIMLFLAEDKHVYTNSSLHLYSGPDNLPEFIKEKATI